MQRLLLKIVSARLFGIIDVNTGLIFDFVPIGSTDETWRHWFVVFFSGWRFAGLWTLTAAGRSNGVVEIGCRFLHRYFLRFGLRSLQRLVVPGLCSFVVLLRTVEPNVPIFSLCLRRQPLVEVYQIFG